jgi:hypothetical protein
MRAKRAGGVAQAEDHLPSKWKALSLNSSIAVKKGRKKEKKNERKEGRKK